MVNFIHDPPSGADGASALDDLRLERVAVIYPGRRRYAVAPAVDAVPLHALRSVGTAEELRARLWAA